MAGLSYYEAWFVVAVEAWFIFITAPCTVIEALVRSFGYLVFSLTYLIAWISIIVPNLCGNIFWQRKSDWFPSACMARYGYCQYFVGP